MDFHSPSENGIMRPWYYGDLKHRYNRRAEWHDYSSRCQYMVTVSRNKEWRKAFSEVVGGAKGSDDKLLAATNLSDFGKIINTWIYEAEHHFPAVEIYNSVIMPDHFHMVISFREKADYTLSNVMNYIKSKSTGDMRKVDAEFASLQISAFEKSFHDRIVFREGILRRLVAYVADNPRRYLMRTMQQDLFRKHHIVMKGNLRLVAYGNIHLLKDPCRSALIVSSRYTQEERERWEAEWEATASVRGVFVSPFISPHEKRLMREFLAHGARMIKIVEHGFWERFKPQGDLFDLCAEGRLLLIGEADENLRKVEMRRKIALGLNDRARAIADAEEDELLNELAYGEEEGWRLRKI